MAANFKIQMVLLILALVFFALLILNIKFNLFNSWFIAIGFFLIYLVHQKFKIKAG